LAYIELAYPFILGNGVAGIVEETGKGVSKFKKGDRVIIDTPSYNAQESKYGGWQRYVVGKQGTAAKISNGTTFEDAAAIPFALLTAVAGLKLKLGMEKPGAQKKGKVLIWGAGSSVGGYAVQYAKSVRTPIQKAVSDTQISNNIRIGWVRCCSHGLSTEI
jgi:NADPH:quinone reductase-like Zn-dependent oxidoreductase